MSEGFKPTHDWVGALPCGCVVRIWSADLDDEIWQLEQRLEALKDGLIVDKRPVQEAIDAHVAYVRQGCPHRTRQLALVAVAEGEACGE